MVESDWRDDIFLRGMLEMTLFLMVFAEGGGRAMRWNWWELNVKRSFILEA